MILNKGAYLFSSDDRCSQRNYARVSRVSVFVTARASLYNPKPLAAEVEERESITPVSEKDITDEPPHLPPIGLV
jgi:hypothetical protein